MLSDRPTRQCNYVDTLIYASYRILSSLKQHSSVPDRKMSNFRIQFTIRIESPNLIFYSSKISYSGRFFLLLGQSENYLGPSEIRAFERFYLYFSVWTLPTSTPNFCSCKKKLQKKIQACPGFKLYNSLPRNSHKWFSYIHNFIIIPSRVEPSDVHANSYPHRGTRGRGWMQTLPRGFDMLQHFETILPSVEILWSSLQDEVYFIGGNVAGGLWRHQQWSPSWPPC